MNTEVQVSQIEAMIATLPTETIKQIRDCAKILNAVCDVFGPAGDMALALVGAKKANQ
jgi:hypothetical protein